MAPRAGHLGPQMSIATTAMLRDTQARHADVMAAKRRISRDRHAATATAATATPHVCLKGRPQSGCHAEIDFSKGDEGIDLMKMIDFSNHLCMRTNDRN